MRGAMGPRAPRMSGSMPQSVPSGNNAGPAATGKGAKGPSDTTSREMSRGAKGPSDHKRNRPKGHGRYDIQRFSAQEYIPVADKRELGPDEQANIAKGESRWFPKLFSHYGTPAHELMASPGKMGLISAVPGALLGGGLGALLGGRIGGGRRGSFDPETAMAGAGIGALGGGGLMGVLGGMAQKQENENINDIMSRLPRGATKRDIMSDPAYQADLTRAAMMAGQSQPGYVVMV